MAGFFDTDSRLNRGAFAAQYFLLAIPAALMAGIASLSGGRLWALDLAAAALMLLTIFPSIKRFHDLGRSGWWVITMMIPLVALIPTFYLLFWRGTAGANSYGQDPLRAATSYAPPATAGELSGQQRSGSGCPPTDALASKAGIQNSGDSTLSAPLPVQANMPSAAGYEGFDDEQIYETVASEIESGNVRKGLWTKLWTELDGDDGKVKLAYIKTRVAQISAEHQEARRKLAEENARKEREKQEFMGLLALESGRNRLREIGVLLDRLASGKHTDIDEEVRLLELAGGTFEWVEPEYSEMCRVRYRGEYRELPDGHAFSKWIAKVVLPNAQELIDGGHGVAMKEHS